MYKIQKYKVIPSLPEELSPLRELAYNLYWTWDHDLRNLYRRLDRDLWERSGHNPVLLLGNIDQKTLETRAKDEGYLSHLQRTKEALEKYLKAKTWFDKTYKDLEPFHTAYFSMEYGLTEGLPIYSGGLGVLSADHLKAASDLGLPLIGVGLLYQKGYFNQYLSRDGWQQELYPNNDFYNMPIKMERDENGNPLSVNVQFLDRDIRILVWRVQVGRIALYLLDTNTSENSPEDQDITDQLYGGDDEMRIKQEIVLGIGGLRALDRLGIRPEVCHMNEGHSAFMALERARMLMTDFNLTFAEAQEATKSGNVFTSHTPVPAGIDEFEPGLLDRYLGAYVDSLNLSREQFHRLGGVHLPQSNGKFNMAIFAINMAGVCNGVSKLHGHVARRMWNYLWPELPEDEVPIGHITNGIHIPTWISEDMAELLNRYLGPKWFQEPGDQSVWNRVQQIPDEELWRTHERRRERLVAFTRAQLRAQMENSSVSPVDLHVAEEVLDPEVLTIGFARRFAEYKRAKLIFSDLDRLSAILNNKDFPVQIILAGKAHPRDNIGKGLIRDISNILRREEFRHRVVFLEDYNMKIAAALVRGVDVWLNTPRRPREASGTSGMKAGVNGALNISILDGWWEEAHRNTVGWAIGRGEEFATADEQDKFEAESLYSLLEQEIVPLFYNQSANGLPREWIRMMKNSIMTLSPQYNTTRMVQEYHQSYYLPGATKWSKLSAEKMRLAKELTLWKENMRQAWPSVKILKTESENGHDIKVGDSIRVLATVETGGLKAEDLRVEVYHGPIDSNGDIITGQGVVMQVQKSIKKNLFVFEAQVSCETTGQQGYSIRVFPKHKEISNPHETGLITWLRT